MTSADPPLSREAIEETAATWIARRDGPHWTSTDAAAMASWLAESTAHRVAYYRLNEAWAAAGYLRKPRIGAERRYVAMAAAVLVVLVSTVFVGNDLFRSPHRSAPAPAAQRAPAPVIEAPANVEVAPRLPSADVAAPSTFERRYTTAVGDSRVVGMPDGSRITLDTDSRIRMSMDARSRTVTLDRGQAFFEVAPDRQRPFTVRSGHLSIVAVGTGFSVRMMGEDVRVVVTEGSVRLGDQLIRAGGITRAEGAAVQTRQGSPGELERNLSWRTGILTFRHTPLAEAAAEFNRYVTRKLVIRDSSIGALELGGAFRASDVAAFARALERTLPVQATFFPDRIEMTSRTFP